MPLPPLIYAQYPLGMKASRSRPDHPPLMKPILMIFEWIVDFCRESAQSRVENRVCRQGNGKNNEEDAFSDCWHPKLPLSSLSISVPEPGAPPQGHRARACH